MSSIPLHQLIMKNAVFSAAVGEDPEAELLEFSDHADNVALATTNTSAAFLAISGVNQSSVSDPSETLVMNIAQSLRTGSLYLFLRENHGRKGRIQLKPTGDEEAMVEAEVTFQAPASLGGAQGGGTSAATLLVKGLAKITPAAAS